MSSHSERKRESVLIVGAGVFGLSTAKALLERGYSPVSVIDRAKELPAVDAASTDLNKIVRSSYGDAFYTRFAREAIREWKTDAWGGCYHEWVWMSSILRQLF